MSQDSGQQGQAIPISSLGPDIYYLILEQIDNREDLQNLCLVSKEISRMATMRLHWRIIIGPPDPRPPRWSLFLGEPGQRQKQPWGDYHPLLCRLFDENNTDLRNAVHEVEIGTFYPYEIRQSIWPELESMNALPRLVRALPNLKLFRIRSTIPITNDFIHELCNHRNQPELHLLYEDSQRDEIMHMPCVKTIHTSVNPFNENRMDSRGNSYTEPNREILKAQKLFFACPNLRSYAISLYGNYGGCVFVIPQHPQIRSFQLSGTEKFPALEELSLDGYHFGTDEWPHWRDRFPWTGLKSLSLGPQDSEGPLSLLKNYTLSLKSLKVETYADDGPGYELPELEVLLRSFNTLESLTVNGYSVSSGAFSNHPNLKHFCMHTIESPDADVERRTLGPVELYDLDINCPQLESLEIDLDRDGEWPQDMLGIIAGGFQNLRSLTIHFELGIKAAISNGPSGSLFGRDSREDDEKAFIKPILDENSAQNLVKMLVELRVQSKQSQFRRITLKQGERLRRFPQWPPGYSKWEEEHARSFEIELPFIPGGEAQMKDLSDRGIMGMGLPPPPLVQFSLT